MPRPEGHFFYRKLNELLSKADFDEFVETLYGLPEVELKDYSKVDGAEADE